jgi:opacity protein-like surface antigen
MYRTALFRSVLTLFVLAVGAVAASAQNADAPKGDVFVGYSYLNIDAGRTRGDSHGVEASVSGSLTDNFSLEGDVSAHYRGGDVLVYALGGPRFTYRGERVEPYAHVLAGGAFVGSTGRFAMAVGGGVDYKVSDRFALRLVQVDYTPIFAEGATLNDFRVSTGVAWRF